MKTTVLVKQPVRALAFAISLLAILSGAFAASSDASSAKALGLQIAGLSQSPTGREADTALARALAGPEARQLVRGVLTQHGGMLTPVQRELLKLGLLMTAPRTRSLVSAFGSHPTPAKARAILELLHTVARNRAFTLVRAKGMALKRNPKLLARYLANAVKEPPRLHTGSSGGTGSVAGAMTAIQRMQGSRPAKRYREGMGRLMSRKSSLRLVRALSPITVASLVPLDQFSEPGLASGQARTSGTSSSESPAGPATLSPDTGAYVATGLGLAKALFDYGQKWVKGKLKKILLTDPYFVGETPGLLATELRIAFVKTFGEAAAQLAVRSIGLGLGWGNVIGGAILGYFLGQQGVDWAAKIIGRYWPTALAVTPKRPNALVKPDEEEEYDVDAIDAAGRNVGPPALGFSLKSSPGGTCGGARCKAGKPGLYLITARSGSAEGTALLHVKVQLQIEEVSLPAASVGQEFQQQFVATGAGSSPLHWSITRAPPTPSDWRISSSGLLSGVPSEAGTWPIGIEVRDDDGNSASSVFDLTVEDALPKEVVIDFDDVSIGIWPNDYFMMAPDRYSAATVSAPEGVFLWSYFWMPTSEFSGNVLCSWGPDSLAMCAPPVTVTFPTPVTDLTFLSGETQGVGASIQVEVFHESKVDTLEATSNGTGTQNTIRWDLSQFGTVDKVILSTTDVDGTAWDDFAFRLP